MAVSILLDRLGLQILLAGVGRQCRLAAWRSPANNCGLSPVISKIRD